MRARILLVCALLVWPVAGSATDVQQSDAQSSDTQQTDAQQPAAQPPELKQPGAQQQVIQVPPGLVGKHNGECKRLTRMISHYADVADMASDRGDDAWRNAMLDHISHLTERRAELCPTLYAQKPIGQELAIILKGAARIAAKLFTMGLI